MSELYKTSCIDCGTQVTFVHGEHKKICVDLESVEANADGETKYWEGYHVVHKCTERADWSRRPLSQKRLDIIFTWLLVLLCALPASARDVVAVHRIRYRDQDYQVVELVKKERERIHWANAFRLRRGKEYASYKLADSAYPLKLPVEETKKNPEFKAVPDDRPFDEKHPDITRGREAIKSWGPLATWLIEVLK